MPKTYPQAQPPNYNIFIGADFYSLSTQSPFTLEYIRLFEVHVCMFALFIMAFVYRLAFAMFLRIYLNKFSHLFFYFSPSNSEALLVCVRVCLFYVCYFLWLLHTFCVSVCVFLLVFLFFFHLQMLQCYQSVIHPYIHLFNGAIVLFFFFFVRHWHVCTFLQSYIFSRGKFIYDREEKRRRKQTNKQELF